MKLASRRTVLALGGGGALALIAGCSVDSLPIVGPPDPDDELRSAVAASEQELIAAYDAAIAAGRDGGALLRTLRQQHVEHLAAVTGDPSLSTATEQPLTSAAATPTTPPTSAALRRLEAAATRQRIKAVSAAGHADLAELFARIAASESGHVAALSKRART